VDFAKARSQICMRVKIVLCRRNAVPTTDTCQSLLRTITLEVNVVISRSRHGTLCSVYRKPVYFGKMDCIPIQSAETKKLIT
jgi:hypothetical protein